MRTGGAAALLLLLLSTIQISRTEDLYWEGEEDASNEFLEVKDTDSGLGGHLRRLKRQWFNFFDPFSSSSTTTESPDDEIATEDTDDVDADLDHYGSGFPEKVEPQDHKEKTLRVTFVVMEPYQHEYSNRDSPQFRNFSRTIADAVDQLYEPLGTRRTSLVRIQSRVSDEFSCKVTLDILTTGYEDINRLIDILRDHIKNRRELASGTRRVTVSDADFSANIIDPDTPLGPCGDDEVACDVDRCFPATSRCNGVRECLDGTDENNCQSPPDDTTPNPTTDSRFYNPYNAQCPNPIPCQDSFTTYCSEQRCDGYKDCPSGEDELNCELNQPYQPPLPEPERTPSPTTEAPALPCIEPIQCQLSDTKYCPNQRCDGNYDCPYQDDEEDCPFDSDQDQSITTTPPTNVEISGPAASCPFPIPCQDSNVTYCPPQRCNSIYDCPNQDDEFDCNDVDNNQYPQPGQYQPENPSYPVTNAPSLPCEYPEQCYDSDVKYCPNQRCDGIPDCPYQDDENGCQRPDDGNQRPDDGNQRPDDENQRRGDQDQTIRCPAGEFQCDKTRCLMDTQRCDGVPDCYDQTDEANCKPIGSDDFRCNNGQSIEASRRCDRVTDCPSGEDEIDCDCLSSEFQCERDGICIESRKKCDGYPDCSDGSDERGCGGHHICKGSGRFRCGDGSCISVRLRCDGYRDCPKDGSDEVHCPCGSDEWQCDHGNCIKRSKRCDGRIDCPTDRSDERNCLEFLCANKVQSIPISQRCDRYYDCDDYSDEKNCPCGVGDYVCNNGFCIPARKRCDGTHDCQDGSDEHNCKNGSENESECMHMFKCTSGECVPPDAQCNGTAECRDRSDESDCHCKRDEYRCQNTDVCISLDKRCDNHLDCDIGDDEFNCENTCEEGQISCAFDNTYVQICAKQCDGKQECLNNEDEQNCPSNPDCSHYCDGRCLDSWRICDRTPDCSDGSDEDDCALCNGPDDFRCDSGECINRNLQCNSIPECSDSSDEFNCKNITTPGPPGDCYDQFQCRDGNCVNKDFFCDGHSDCPDNSDEENCGRTTCRQDARKQCIGINPACSGPGSGTWVNFTAWYMGRPSRSPIPPEPCLEAEFTCYDGRCITHSRRCDNVYDCLDFSDEQNCHTSACKEGEFQCRSGQCIPESGLCDNYPQCDDGSDEVNCVLSPPTRPPYFPPPMTTHRPTTDVWTPQPYPPYTPPPASSGCGFSQWQCENGHCIDEGRRCDGRIDCSDTTDEFNCPLGSPVALNLKTYPDQQNVTYFGDVVFDCRDEGPQRARVTWVRGDGRRMNPNFKITGKGRLELNNVTTADSGTYICQAVEFQNAPGSQKTVYLQVEKQITSPRQRSRACGPQEATCSNLKCIPKSAICDGKQDCGDGSDEHSCGSSMSRSCQPNQFRCANNRCILKTWVCDSENDCDDGSDEDPQQCGSLNSTEGCSPVEYACKSGNQCIPKSYHCDHLSDCMDGSDELTCAPVYVVKPPQPPNVRIFVGDVLTLSCKATGVPVPLISWRLNWGHVPPQCTSTSDNGEGRLICPDMRPEHSGAYSCEAINNKGATFATPDSIVIVEHDPDICPVGKFNSEAHDSSECIECFCFGKSKQCKSAELFVYDMAESLGQGGTRLVGVKLDGQGPQIDSQSITNEYYYQPGRNGASVTKLSYGSRGRSYAHPYLTVPASYTGKQLTSYGGEIKYSLSSQSAYPSPRYDNYMPDIIILGKYETLSYTQNGDKSTIQVKLVPGSWQKYSSGRPEFASRVDIMMALDNVENILLRAELNGAGVNITDFLMQSAKNIDQGLGPANLVEECTCPEGYTGLSCENCASGYERDSSGPLIGHCRPQRRQCPPGTFGDPANGYACSPCPCPLTTPSNQFASTCYLGPSGVVCDCQPGYEGNNCEYCAEGYEGNPNTLGDSCRKVQVTPCDPTGTKQIQPLERCECKDNVQGQYCDQCKNGFYFLSPDFTHGCAACFCSGVTQNCGSSNLRRKTTHVVFNSESSVSQLSVYSSTSSRSGYNAPTAADVVPVFENGAARAYIDNRAGDVYYWSLPASFAGDKVTSYGGNLYYTLDNVPYNYNPGSGAADVQLISENSLTFHHVADVRPSSSGILNVTVPFFETKWMRVDGKEVPREQFLLALADVKTILVKAKYDRGDELASLIRASIETAEPGGTGPTALHVEQCVCPKEYIGTSCEDCAPGYKRYPHGLYLEKCGPCECNGHSSMCDPDSGVCMNCRDNTAGDFCEECLPGFQKDAYNNCVRTTVDRPSCECDPSGITVPCEEVGYCQCKQNVEGSSCNRCRPGTFGLDSENPAGCLSCYCSGVSSECHETSNFKRIPMAAPIFGDNYGGYSITNLNGNNVVASNFVPMPDYSELMYTFPFPPNDELFWSLPVFPGNRVLSYGGILQFDQKFEDHSPEAIPDTHKHVILIGDDTSVYWNSPAPIESGEKLQVPLREDEWYLLNSATPASRNDFMNVLKSLRRVLVKATLSRDMLSTSIADVSMDTATTISGSEYPSVKGIEVCMCPPGYTGTSCETCASGFYKDERGRCRECSCNGHECQLGVDNQMVCLCRPPYTGPTCTTYGLSMELQPTLEEDPEDGPLFRKVTLTCKYAAHEPLTIRFYSEGSEVGVPKLYNESVFDKEGWRGEHVWHTVWDTRTDTIYECHTITKKGATMGVLTATMPEPGETTPPPNSTLPPVVSPTIEVTISQPIVIKEIGGSVTFTCQARSRMVNGNLPVRWSKAGGYLPRDRAIVDENSGTLVIMQLQKTDTGKYICETSDGQSTNQAVATLTVGDNPRRSPEVSIEPAVNEYNEGDRIELVCRATGNPEPTISWRRADSRKPLPNSATIYGGTLIIQEALEEDSGDYRCTASNTEGSSDRIALIIVRPRPYSPSRDRLTVSTNSPVVNEGNSTSVTCTGTPGIPAGTIQWVRQDGTDLQYNVRSDNGVLYVENAQPENQGVYLCQTLYSRVNPVAISLTVIPVVSPPEDAPNITVSVDTLRIPTGGSGSVDCSPSGYPLPVIKWTKHDGRFGPGTSQRGNTLMITNAQNDDQGFYECEGLINNEPRSNIYVYVEIERREAPQVHIYPEDPQPVTIGDSYELRCQVTGGVPDPVVTWESSRPMTANAHILPDNILKFENIDVNDEGAYTCTASNSAGKANATSIVKVQSYPVITMTPSNQISAQLGDSINFVCRATGVPLPNVSIKYENGREIVPPSPGSATLHIDSASERDSGSYRCLASSPAGTLDEPFIIDLNRGDLGFEPVGTEQPDYDPSYNPYDTGNNNVGEQEPPMNQIILTEGKENVLRCDAEGYDANWARTDRQPLQRNVRPYGDQLIFADTSRSDAGEYECILYDLRTREPVNAITYRVDVLGLPRVTIQPPTQTVHPGESTSVDCIVDGDQIQDVTWQLSRQSNRIEVQNSRLIFHQIEVDDAGDYVCTARNPIAEVNGTAKVIVTDDTRVPKKSQNTEQYALVNSNVHLNCTTRQRHTTTEWTKDGRPLPRSRKTTTKNDGSLFIKSAKKSDSGRYACIITDAYGRKMTKHIVLHVSGPPMASALVSIDQPRRQYRVGENVEVTCRKASRDTTATWEKYGTKEFVETREYNEGVVLVILGVEESDRGVYRCIGRDRYGYTSYEDFELDVQPSQQPPSYEMSNHNVHVAHVGQTVDMPCRHNLEPPVSIEWRKEYLTLPPYVRQNEPILTLRNITEADAGTYVCRITNQRAALEARSTLKVTGVVPRFDGNSWLAVPTIKDAYRQFDIEVSFKPSTADGTILYNSQRPDGSGDYLALQLANGIPVFTLETGSSMPVVVEGDRPLQLNAWHTVRLSRVNSKVSMFVDETGPFVSELRSPWEVLDLSDPLYVGAVPDYVSLPTNLNTTYGFVGCISMLVLSKTDVNLIPDSVDSRNVGECDTCAPNLCLNEGVCQEARNERGYICLCAAGFAGLNCNRTGEACRPGLCGPGRCTDTADGYSCVCPLTYTGKNCDMKQYIEYPAFTGSAYLAIKVPTTSRVLRVAMNVKASSPVSDGIIMYWAESARGTGGFTALTVHNGRLEFIYDLGDGYPVVITANRTLQPNEWTDVRVARVGSSVSLTVNQVHTYSGRLSSSNTELTLDTPMFVGGVDDAIVLNSNLGVSEGFNGCIKDLSVFNDPVNIITSSIQSANIKECSTYKDDRGDIPEIESVCSQCRNGGQCAPDSSVCTCPAGYTGTYCENRASDNFARLPRSPCADSPCRNGGTCKVDQNSRMKYACDCPLGYGGANCQMILQLLQSVAFNGNGYIELPSSLLSYDNLETDPAVIALAMHTMGDGVLLYQRQALQPAGYGDYVMIRVEKGVIVLEWDMGGGPQTLSINEVFVADGERHSIIVKILPEGEVYLSVDSVARTAATNSLQKTMNADSNIYVGGMPESLNMNRYPGLAGCIEQVELMNSARGLNLGEVAVAARNTQLCKDY